MASHRLTLQALLQAHPRLLAGKLPVTSPIPELLSRSYHPSKSCSIPYKDDQDRQTLKPRPSDSTKSGSDLDLSDHEDASFNPTVTSPEEAKKSVQRESNGSPLEFSGANKPISDSAEEKRTSGKEDHPDHESKSKGSQGKKAGKVSPKK
ncbi:hypothetical protein B0H67DRAFT_315760 [Lasiosphaeris hirsuta]|uniref:Uncharacterized protein n=1 Tax=Lasiosphaeris hirsuta TaxID=260670 RepID=A0AA40DPQ3_9PEZI|nr:hypothetical protein B0H67DRAFT_315760 [Lasiosphaeris hirsuta]